MQNRIRVLARERRAVILAHHYQLPEVQAAADHVGDSLGLSLLAARSEAEVIVFCGVHFMAETAAILNPRARVLLPAGDAGCPMADMATAEGILAWRRAHPGGLVVSYVNTTAAVKAVSDICCTSANAVAVVDSLPKEGPILFTPDRNLGDYVARQLGRPLELWRGWCPTHERILPERVEEARRAHPDAEVVVHPECRPGVVAMADWVGSTTGILKHCHASAAREFLIGTENGVLPTLRRENPDKIFHPLSPLCECPNMKKTTLAKLRGSLETLSPVMTVDSAVADKARIALERMLALSQG